MVEFSTILQFIQATGIIVGVIYYILNIQNNQRNQQLALKAQEQATEARQLDIYMKWQQIRTNLDWMKTYTEVASMEWDDFDDFARKYSHSENPDNAGKRFAVWSYFDGLGYMLFREVIDAETMYDMTGNGSIAFWTMYEPIINGFRERDGRPETWRWFEYLATEMKKVREHRGLPDYELPWKPD